MHDKNGKPIKKGDKVSIEAEIVETNASDTYCNITLKIGDEQPHGPHNIHGMLALNAKQVELKEES